MNSKVKNAKNAITPYFSPQPLLSQGQPKIKSSYSFSPGKILDLVSDSIHYTLCHKELTGYYQKKIK